MNTKSYSTRRMPDNCDDELLVNVGDYTVRFIDGQPQGFQIRMPMISELGTLDYLPIEGARYSAKGWKFTGTLDSPTLEPSLEIKGHWHGHLTSGRLVSC
jgi:hypothetical protein